MKILFSNPPWFEAENRTTPPHLRQGIRSGSRWPFTRVAIHEPEQFRFGGYLPFPFFLAHAASLTKEKIPEATVEMRDSIARGESYIKYFLHLRREQPDWIVIETATPSWTHDLNLIEQIARVVPETKIILGGTLEAAKAKNALELPGVVAVVQGEFDKQIAKVIVGERGHVAHDLLSIAEMNAAPAPMFDEDCALNYWDPCPVGNRDSQLQLLTSRGCPYRCLAGDTPVNTVEGLVPIRELVGRSIGVFTYTPEEKRAKIVTVSDIRKTGERQKLVRVRFDDGSHLDCTPDHRLMVFKWANQHVPEREWLVEAKDLKPRQRIRSLSVHDSLGYPVACWNRRRREKIHRMVAEWKIGRRLKPEECVHHKDRNKANWHPDNIEVMASTKAHFAEHPEIAERMRTNNPTANGMSDAWRAKISESNNHKVVSVEELPGEHDTFCMEVPETHLFFANNLLVRNCIFCVWPAVMTGNDPDGTKPRSVRFYSPENVEARIRLRIAAAKAAGRSIDSIYLDDDTFNLAEKHTLAISEVMGRIELPWSAMCRADTISRDAWRAMKDAGCTGVKIGFESGVQDVVDRIVNKKLNIAEALETALWLRSELKISVHGTFTVGLPGETQEEIRATKKFIGDALVAGALNSYQLSGTAEIEGTPLHTLRTAGHLSKYERAAIDPDSAIVSDGQRKVESMAP